MSNNSALHLCNHFSITLKADKWNCGFCYTPTHSFLNAHLIKTWKRLLRKHWAATCLSATTRTTRLRTARCPCLTHKIILMAQVQTTSKNVSPHFFWCSMKTDCSHAHMLCTWKGGNKTAVCDPTDDYNWMLSSGDWKESKIFTTHNLLNDW